LSLHWAVRHREHIFQRLLAQRFSRSTLPVETLPTTLQELWSWADRHREQLFQRLLLAERLSHKETRPADTLSAVTFPVLYPWAVRYREQLFERLLAERHSHRANSLPINSPSSHFPRDSPKALSLAGSSQAATLSARTQQLTCRVSLPGVEKREGEFPWSEQDKQERENHQQYLVQTGTSKKER
jgi:hypothetical protein